MPRSQLRRAAVIAPLVLAGLVAGCDVGGPPRLGGPSVLPAGSSPEAGSSATATPGGTPSLPAIADPTPVPTAPLAEPPAALLAGGTLPGEPAVGDLGSYTWGEAGSDAPWIVSGPGPVAKPGTPVAVTFDPEVAPPSWIVRWAPITPTGAGDVASAFEGTGPVEFAIPDTVGAWSLQLDARFGTGRAATWYWRVDVE